MFLSFYLNISISQFKFETHCQKGKTYSPVTKTLYMGLEIEL